MILPITVDITVAESEQQFDLTVEELSNVVSVSVETPVVTSTVSDYDGEYDITPTDTAQTFSTNGKRVLHDFVVEPIPSNYGKITYNGSILTVS